MARRRRKRHREREQFWPQVLEEGQAGGQSVSAFCRARRLSLGSFYAWRRRLAAWTWTASGAGSGTRSRLRNRSPTGV